MNIFRRVNEVFETRNSFSYYQTEKNVSGEVYFNSRDILVSKVPSGESYSNREQLEKA